MSLPYPLAFYLDAGGTALPVEAAVAGGLASAGGGGG
jgi:hypothetical protein